MIIVTDISGSRFYLNNDMIERVEMVPDTLVIMANGNRYVLRESSRDIVRLVEAHKRRTKHLRRHPLRRRSTSSHIRARQAETGEQG